ncbi:MAG: serine/threonine protein kinase [Labilithrix sp.]|nr:serine/threonine protein kinase [Labilithrix sp.]
MRSESNIELRSSRYRILTRIANGGMGSVYMAAQHGAAGFRRVVAIKRAFPHLLEDPSFRRLVVTEVRLASLVRHPNVVAVSDVEESDGELSLVMEYVEGGSFADLLRSGAPLSIQLALRVVLDATEGLQAIHVCTDEDGRPLSLVHRDISPQNILVGVDGVARIADFGIAQARESGSTVSGLLRGKPAYMAPEYVETSIATPACDVYALAIVAWEALTGRRLFRAATDVETLDRARAAVVPAPSLFNPAVTPELDAVMLRALARDPAARYPSAIAFGQALAASVPPLTLTTRAELGAHVRAVAGPVLDQRRASLTEIHTLPAPPEELRPSCAELPPVVEHVRPPVATSSGRSWAIAVVLGLLLALGGAGLARRSAPAAKELAAPLAVATSAPPIAPASVAAAPSPRFWRRHRSSVVATSRPAPRASSRPAPRATATAAPSSSLLASPPRRAPDNPYAR